MACLTLMLSVFQVLKGDIKPAIEIHEMLYQVTQIHNFLPEVSHITCPVNPVVGRATILSPPAESVSDGQSDTFVVLPEFLAYFSWLIPCVSGTGCCGAITIIYIFMK